MPAIRSCRDPGAGSLGVRKALTPGAAPERMPERPLPPDVPAESEDEPAVVLFDRLRTIRRDPEACLRLKRRTRDSRRVLPVVRGFPHPSRATPPRAMRISTYWCTVARARSRRAGPDSGPLEDPSAPLSPVAGSLAFGFTQDRSTRDSHGPKALAAVPGTQEPRRRNRLGAPTPASCCARRRVQ